MRRFFRALFREVGMAVVYIPMGLIWLAGLFLSASSSYSMSIKLLLTTAVALMPLALIGVGIWLDRRARR